MMKNKHIALDTNILIDHFNASPRVDELLGSFDCLHIPVPVIAEMEYGYQLLKKSDPKKKIFDEFLNRKDIKIIVCDREAAKRFAEIKRELKNKGAMIPINDIWIAACCITSGLSLATRDSHFQRIPELKAEIWQSVF